MKRRMIREGDRIRVLVVDDSAVVRTAVSHALGTNPALEVVGTASSGALALQRIPQLNPDVITLDVEMPDMDGLETLRQLRVRYPQLPVIMLSALTEAGAAVTVEALALGANDYAAKSTGSREGGDFGAAMAAQLTPKILQFFDRDPEPSAAGLPESRAPLRIKAAVAAPPEVVAIGVSTGGPNALSDILPTLPASFPLPILIVQHMPAVFTRLLAERLDKQCRLEVKEATDGMTIQPGRILIAPGNYHMRARRSHPSPVVQLDQEPPENSCRPAADVLFRSVADTWGGAAIGIILTGMGKDGAMGLRTMKSAGACVLAQDAESSVVWGMPGAVVRAGLADVVLPLAEIVPEMLVRVKVPVTHG